MNRKSNRVKIFGKVAHIVLSGGKVARVDSEDVQRSVEKYFWSFNGRYAVNILNGIHMSRFIMGAKKGEQVDHINRDKLDNRKKNLRFVTHQQNVWNRCVYKNNKIGVRGVQFFEKTYPFNNVPANRPYLSRINVDGKNIHLGYFSTLDDAKNARLMAERKYHMEFASCAGKRVKDVANVLRTERINLRKMNAKNTTGVRGVYIAKHKSGNKSYCANIWVKKDGKMKHIHLGSFKSLSDAKNARSVAERKYWGVVDAL
jgi:hypothetical protein